MSKINPGSADAEKVYQRGRQLCQRIGETPQLFPVLWGLWLIHSSRGEYRTALDLGEELLSLARQLDDRGLLLQAEHALWNTLVYGGEFVSGLAHAKQGIALYDPGLHRSHALVYGGHDPGECCRRHAATALWLLGYPDQAMETARSGLRLARDLGHLHSVSWAMAVSHDASSTPQRDRRCRRTSNSGPEALERAWFCGINRSLQFCSIRGPTERNRCRRSHNDQQPGRFARP
jgi:predicted ATPase